MTHPRDILLFGGATFHDPRSSVQKQMALSLADRGCRVLYTEAVPSPSGSKDLTSAGSGSIHIRSLVRNPFLPMTYPGWNRRLNMVRNRKRLRELVGELDLRDFVTLHYGWFSPELAGTLGQSVDVLDCIDADEERPGVVRFAGLRDYVIRTENRLLEKVDGLVMTSPALAERRTTRVEKHTVLLNGVNPGAFAAEAPEPGSLRNVPGPRAALAGVAGPKIDLNLVGELLHSIPELHVVVLGPVLGGSKRVPDNSRLHLLGPTEHRDLGAYLSHCDVGIIPLTDTPYNRGSCPLKALEYLASGIPVASVPNPAVEVLAEEHPGLIFAPATRSGFVQSVQEAVEAGRRDDFSEEARLAASAHSWDRRAEQLLDFISSL